MASLGCQSRAAGPHILEEGRVESVEERVLQLTEMLKHSTEISPVSNRGSWPNLHGGFAGLKIKLRGKPTTQNNLFSLL